MAGACFFLKRIKTRINNQLTMMKSLYKWHHRLGLLVTLPILGWCISGLTHPIMANFFKIRPAHRAVTVQAPKLDSTALSLKQILEQEGIQQFKQVRWMRYEDQPYYQIIQPKQAATYLHLSLIHI